MSSLVYSQRDMGVEVWCCGIGVVWWDMCARGFA